MGTNIMPALCQVAQGYHDKLEIFGNDYNTKDGTGNSKYKQSKCNNIYKMKIIAKKCKFLDFWLILPSVTAERDYVHVMDLCRGHVLALSHLLSGSGSPYQVIIGS